MKTDEINPVRCRAGQFSMPGGLVLFRQSLHVLLDVVAGRFGFGGGRWFAALHFRPPVFFCFSPAGKCSFTYCRTKSSSTAVISFPSAAVAVLNCRCSSGGMMMLIRWYSSFIEGGVFAMGILL